MLNVGRNKIEYNPVNLQHVFMLTALTIRRSREEQLKNLSTCVFLQYWYRIAPCTRRFIEPSTWLRRPSKTIISEMLRAKGKRPVWIKFFRREDTNQHCRAEESYVEKFRFGALIRCGNPTQLNGWLVVFVIDDLSSNFDPVRKEKTNKQTKTRKTWLTFHSPLTKVTCYFRCLRFEESIKS